MGHHIDHAGRFQSDKYPDLSPDKILLSFRDKATRRALEVLAEDYQSKDPGLAKDILDRLSSVTEEKQRMTENRELDLGLPDHMDSYSDLPLTLGVTINLQHTYKDSMDLALLERLICRAPRLYELADQLLDVYEHMIDDPDEEAKVRAILKEIRGA